MTLLKNPEDRWGAWLAWLVGDVTLDLGLVYLSPMLVVEITYSLKKFSFLVVLMKMERVKNFKELSLGNYIYQKKEFCRKREKNGTLG